ncbi:hypothetical protein CONLIGDRAFT_280394 [Coniochaeta ligniaria NRRL 30616]|uniref:Uncharacterized protein n=1 Tax=Coniochaeta ligniaria NRRL 30616 TaxID=1408157 RepID=A0A1J7IS82_9PEZI|nr:hypothetical protein CONLIGDRAFT_280394 [Coniochaeta ligniaria NRRL 30616]
MVGYQQVQALRRQHGFDGCVCRSSRLHTADRVQHFRRPGMDQQRLQRLYQQFVLAAQASTSNINVFLFVKVASHRSRCVLGEAHSKVQPLRGVATTFCLLSCSVKGRTKGELVAKCIRPWLTAYFYSLLHKPQLNMADTRSRVMARVRGRMGPSLWW